MGDDTDDTSLVPAPPPQTADLELFEQRLVNFIGDRGLPTTNRSFSPPRLLVSSTPRSTTSGTRPSTSSDAVSPATTSPTSSTLQ